MNVFFKLTKQTIIQQINEYAGSTCCTVHCISRITEEKMTFRSIVTCVRRKRIQYIYTYRAINKLNHKNAAIIFIALVNTFLKYNKKKHLLHEVFLFLLEE